MPSQARGAQAQTGSPEKGPVRSLRCHASLPCPSPVSRTCSSSPLLTSAREVKASSAQVFEVFEVMIWGHISTTTTTTTTTITTNHMHSYREIGIDETTFDTYT